MNTTLGAGREQGHMTGADGIAAPGLDGVIDAAQAPLAVRHQHSATPSRMATNRHTSQASHTTRDAATPYTA
jgi:hypothetical protein